MIMQKSRDSIPKQQTADEVMHWTSQAPPLVLIVVAVVQILLATQGGLSPWKGGGFGMFSSSDGPDSRVVEVTGITRDGESVVLRNVFALPSNQRSRLHGVSARRLHVFPTVRQCERLGNAILNCRFVEIDSGWEALQTRFVKMNPSAQPLIAEMPKRPVRTFIPWDPRRLNQSSGSTYDLTQVSIVVYRLVYSGAANRISLVPLLSPVTIRIRT